MACFAAGHRAIWKKDLNNIDVAFWKLFRSVVGPPAAINGSHPWHEILHDWTARVVQFVEQFSTICRQLQPDRWLSRILTWTCRRSTSDTMIQKFCRYEQLGNWMDVAGVANRPSKLMPQFTTFRAHTWTRQFAGHSCVLSISLVPFTGSLQACRVHFSSLCTFLGVSLEYSVNPRTARQSPIVPGKSQYIL